MRYRGDRAGEVGTPPLMAIYARLRGARGHAGWWPGETPFEVCLGRDPRRRTRRGRTWRRPSASCARAGRLSYEALRRAAGAATSRPLIRSVRLLQRQGPPRGRVPGLPRPRVRRPRRGAWPPRSPAVLRAKLLAVHGIGRETADSIALYAAGLPLFVVDAYTRRIFARLGLLRGRRDLRRGAAPLHGPAARATPRLYNDYHAQIVLLARTPAGRCPV